MQVLNINYTPQYHYRYYPSFQAYERTFVMIKPDAFERGLDSKIMKSLEENGLTISKRIDGITKREKFEQLYQQYSNKNFFEEWVNYLTNGQIRALIVEGEDAIDKVLKVKKQIRSEYTPNEKRYNLMHSSDTVDDAMRESGIFFDSVA